MVLVARGIQVLTTILLITDVSTDVSKPFKCVMWLPHIKCVPLNGDIRHFAVFISFISSSKGVNRYYAKHINNDLSGNHKLPLQ